MYLCVSWCRLLSLLLHLSLLPQEVIEVTNVILLLLLTAAPSPWRERNES
jgi:hypothetical protein